MNIYPKIKFWFFKKILVKFRSVNCIARSNIHSIHFEFNSVGNIGTKIFNTIPNEIKKQAPFQILKINLKIGFTELLLQTLQNIWGASSFYVINLLLMGILMWHFFDINDINRAKDHKNYKTIRNNFIHKQEKELWIYDTISFITLYFASCISTYLQLHIYIYIYI